MEDRQRPKNKRTHRMSQKKSFFSPRGRRKRRRKPRRSRTRKEGQAQTETRTTIRKSGKARRWRPLSTTRASEKVGRATRSSQRPRRQNPTP